MRTATPARRRAHLYLPRSDWLPLPRPGPSAAPRLALLLVLVLLVWVGMRPLSTPDVVPATAPAAEFSAERAMEHLQVIAASRNRLARSHGDA